MEETVVIGSVAALARLQQGMGAGDDVLVSYVPVLMIFVVAAGFAVTMVTLSRLVGQRKPTKEKMMPYECGKDPVGSARERHSVRFYLVAMIFLLFDIEAIFLIPWAVAYGRVLEGGLDSWRWTAETATSMKFLFYGEMMFFIVVLFLGLIYVWKKGVLEWNR